MIKFRTERLVIRDHIPEDIEHYQKLFSDDEVMYFLEGIKCCDPVKTEKLLNEAVLEAAKQEKRKKYFFGIFLKSGEYLGEIGYTVLSTDPYNNKCVELGYFIHRAFWNKGYITEAVARIIRFAFEENSVCKIETGCLADNCASEKVMIKSGFVKESHKQRHQWLDNRWMDRVEYGMTKEIYERLARD